MDADGFRKAVCDGLGVDPSARGSLREPSYVRGTLGLDSVLRSLGLRRCPGCGSAIPEDGPDHAPEECLVTEVMES